MASNINPNNIDGSYPVAGQDNSSQGFRDNFTNIKVNFQFAEDEINDLQNKVLLKAALTGGTLNNNMNDALLYAAKIQDFAASKVTIGSASGSVAVNYASGHYQSVATSGSISLSFTNFPASGNYGYLKLQIQVTNVAHTVTLPASVSLGTAGIQGLVGSTITFSQPGYYEFGFGSYDGGSTITIFDLNRPLTTTQMAVLSSDYVAANSASAQKVFNNSSNGAVALAANTAYEIEGLYVLTRSAGTTSHTLATLFAVTGSLTSIMYMAETTSTAGNALGTVSRIYATSAGATTVTGASTSANENITVRIKGIIRSDTAGTLTPQIQYSAAPGGAPTVLANSYFKVTAIGNASVTSIGNWT